MKAKLAVDPKHTFNIYVADLGGGLLGWTTLPEMLVEDSNQNKVVVLDESLPGGKAYRYNLGYTLVHEAGHYLGLYHTFQVSDSLFFSTLHHRVVLSLFWNLLVTAQNLTCFFF